ncbi:hypothetical protein DFH08DRAFT_796943 [Mycena albidolilacea]|uniref:Uncharacterized protein n=1 Tax=Mycena albidolilacea TaxID=1033008 RepID=A0AAD7AW70_9AGAR|nr:hypothetical protein DFH08DRAFT_796943 [Mycena albidolilacea]
MATSAIVNDDGGSNINANGNVIIGNNDNNNQISTNGGLQAQAAFLLVLLVLFAILFLGTPMLWIRERRLRKRNIGAIEEGTEELACSGNSTGKADGIDRNTIHGAGGGSGSWDSETKAGLEETTTPSGDRNFGRPSTGIWHLRAPHCNLL